MNDQTLSPEAQTKLNNVETRLRADVARATAAGLKVTTGEWGLTSVDPDGVKSPVFLVDPDGCLCPMACAIVGKPTRPTVNGDPDEIAAEILGITSNQVSNFVVGFDGAEDDVSDWTEDEYYQLGKKFRQEMVD